MENDAQTTPKKMMIALNRNSDFLRVYRRGKSAVHPLVVCYALPNRRGQLRCGFTASKKIGNAVARNRARRVLRAAFRELEPKLGPGWDLVLVARTGTPKAKSTALLPILDGQLRRLKVLQGPDL